MAAVYSKVWVDLEGVGVADKKQKLQVEAHRL